MIAVSEGLYIGTVVHKRLRPIEHGLSYRVFSCLFDCSRLDALDERMRLFSYNRFNLFSLFDRDHTNGDGLQEYLERIAKKSGHGGSIKRFMMLCYPRVLGYVFNPLTVYYGLDADDEIRLIIYEVRNTFGGKQTYVIPAAPKDGSTIFQRCRKRFYVSPYNNADGLYSFHATLPAEEVTLGVALTADGGPILKAHFRGKRVPFNDKNLLKAAASTGWLTVKVIAAIHYEALKLWLKGMRFVPKPAAADASITYLPTPHE